MYQPPPPTLFICEELWYQAPQSKDLLGTGQKSYLSCVHLYFCINNMTINKIKMMMMMM